MGRTDIWIVDENHPEGHWTWIGGYKGSGFKIPIYATAVGTSVTLGEALAIHSGTVEAVASGLSLTEGNAIASSVTPTYLALDGAAGTTVTTPWDAAFTMSGGPQTYRFRLRKPTWTPAEHEVLVDRWAAQGTWSYYLRWNNTGVPYFQYSTNGTIVTSLPLPPAPSPALPVDTFFWLQIQATAAAELIVSTHPDQEAEPTTGWTPVAIGSSGGTFTSTYAGSRLLRIGGWGTLNNTEADVAQMTIRDKTDTKIFQLDPQNWVGGSTWVTSLGHTMTLNGTASIQQLA